MDPAMMHSIVTIGIIGSQNKHYYAIYSQSNHYQRQQCTINEQSSMSTMRRKTPYHAHCDMLNETLDNHRGGMIWTCFSFKIYD